MTADVDNAAIARSRTAANASISDSGTGSAGGTERNAVIGLTNTPLLHEAIVEVRRGREAGGADASDEVALLHARAWPDGDRRQVQVFRLVAVGVPQSAPCARRRRSSPADTTTPPATATTGAPAGAR